MTELEEQLGIRLNELQLVPVDKIKLDPSNPNVMTPDQMTALDESMRRFGYLTPVILDENFLVADGEHRLEIYKRYGRKEIPCYVVKFRSDEERRLLRQVMNKLHGAHDKDKDAAELKILYDADKLDDLSRLIAGEKEDYLQILNKKYDIPLAPPEADEIPTNVEPRVKKGEIWQLGRHRLMCGSASELNDMQNLVGQSKADLIFTDPPYNVGLEYNSYEDNIEAETYQKWMGRVFEILCELSKNDAAIYLMSGDKFFLEIPDGFRERFRFSQLLLWIKEAATLGNSDYQYNYEAILYGWKKQGKHQFYGTNYELAARQVERDKGSAKVEHPAQRPVELVAYYIRNSSRVNESILDCFGGSGTTLIACEQMGRTCLMMEIDPHYCDVIIARFEKFSGIRAERIST